MNNVLRAWNSKRSSFFHHEKIEEKDSPTTGHWPIDWQDGCSGFINPTALCKTKRETHSCEPVMNLLAGVHASFVDQTFFFYALSLPEDGIMKSPTPNFPEGNILKKVSVAIWHKT